MQKGFKQFQPHTFWELETGKTGICSVGGV